MGKESSAGDSSEMTNLEELWEQYLPLAHSVALKFSFPPQWEEDAHAEAEIALWRACTTYNGKASFSTYAHTVIWKQVRDFSRYIYNSKRTPNNTLPLEWYVHIKYDNIDSTINAKEIMASLSKVDSVLYLCSIHGYKHREIAEKFGVSRSVISKRIAKSREKLRKILMRKGILEAEKEGA